MQLIPMGSWVRSTVLWHRSLPVTHLLWRLYTSRDDLFSNASVRHSSPHSCSAVNLALLFAHPRPSLICEGIWLRFFLRLSCWSSRASSQHIYSTQSLFSIITSSIALRNDLFSISTESTIIFGRLKSRLSLVINFRTFILRRRIKESLSHSTKWLFSLPWWLPLRIRLRRILPSWLFI